MADEMQVFGAGGKQVDGADALIAKAGGVRMKSVVAKAGGSRSDDDEPTAEEKAAAEAAAAAEAKAGKKADDSGGKKDDDGEGDFDLVDFAGNLLDEGGETGGEEGGKKDEGGEAGDPDMTRWTEQQRHAYASMREENRRLKEQVAQRASQPAQTPEEVEKLKRDLQAAHDELGRLDLERDPRFQAKYAGEAQLLQARLAKIGEEYGLDAASLTALQGMGVRARNQQLRQALGNSEDLSPITSALGQMDMLRERRAQELANWKATSEGTRQESARRRMDTMRAMKDQYLGDAVTSLAAEGHFLVKEIPGNERFNRQVATIKAKMGEAFEVADPKKQAVLIASGVMAPVLLKLYQGAAGEISELRRQLTAAGATVAPVKRRKPSASGPAPVKRGEAMKPGDAALRALADVRSH